MLEYGKSLQKKYIKNKKQRKKKKNQTHIIVRKALKQHPIPTPLSLSLFLSRSMRLLLGTQQS